MTVAAVIPHWNRRDLLEPLFASLGAQTKAFDEIILVDNGSTDGSAELAARYGTVVRLERNLGFAAAVNRGIASTKADWIAILNNDVTLAADWLEKLLECGAAFATERFSKRSTIRRSTGRSTKSLAEAAHGAAVRGDRTLRSGMSRGRFTWRR